MKTDILVKWAGILTGTLFLGSIDWITGYELNFFVFYFAPVSFAAWHFGYRASNIVAIMSALIWCAADVFSGHSYSSSAFAVWNTAIRLSSFVAIGWAVWRIHGLVILERDKTEAVKRSLAQIKVLEGLLPICAQCKKIRDKQGQWELLETYIGKRSNAQFTHGYCPDCAKRWLEKAGLPEALIEQVSAPTNGLATSPASSGVLQGPASVS